MCQRRQKSMALEDDDPLLLEAEPWVDQARCSFYPDVWKFTGIDPVTIQSIQEVVRELVPVHESIREHDKKLADQLRRAAHSLVLNIAEGRGDKGGNAELRFATACGSAKEVRAALSIASDWGYIEGRRAAHLDARLDRVCAITWCLSRRR